MQHIDSWEDHPQARCPDRPQATQPEHHPLLVLLDDPYGRKTHRDQKDQEDNDNLHNRHDWLPSEQWKETRYVGARRTGSPRHGIRVLTQVMINPIQRQVGGIARLRALNCSWLTIATPIGDELSVSILPVEQAGQHALAQDGLYNPDYTRACAHRPG